MKTPGVGVLIVFLAPAIPLNLLALQAIVKLDRSLNFSRSP